MREIRRFMPSTLSRRFSVAAGFYRPCVVDGILKHSSAEQVRRPAVLAESPTLGLPASAFALDGHGRGAVAWLCSAGARHGLAPGFHGSPWPGDRCVIPDPGRRGISW